MKRYCILLIFALMTISVHFVFAQPYTHVLGTATTNEGASCLVIDSVSGDYFIGGYRSDSALVIRTDAAGNVIWAKAIDFGPDPDYIIDLHITSDNNLAGTSKAYPNANLANAVFKMDLNGNLLWTQVISHPNGYSNSGIQEVANGNYRVAGYTFKSNNFQQPLVCELNSSTGAVVWDSIYAFGTLVNNRDEIFYDIIEHPGNNGTYAMGRLSGVGGWMHYRPGLAKFSSSGELEWCKTYLFSTASSAGRFYNYGGVVDGDSILICAFGEINGTGNPYSCVLLKTDTLGNIGWSRYYSSPAGSNLQVYSVVNTPNGYIMAGSDDAVTNDLFLIKTDKQGNLVWSNTYGSTGIEESYLGGAPSRVIVDGNNVVTIGRTDSYSGNFDVYLVKADLATGALNNAGCYDTLTVVQSDITPYQEDYPLAIGSNSFPNVSLVVPSESVNLTPGQLLEVGSDTIVGGDTMMLCPGTSIVLKVNWAATGMSFIWSTASTLDSISISAPGTYWVEAIGPEGCSVWSDTVEVLFLNSPVASIIGDTVVCSGDSATLTALGGTSYLWSSSDTAASITVMPDTTTTYFVTVSSENCSDTASVQVVVTSNPIVFITGVISICDGDSVSLTASGGGSYSWSTSDTTSGITVSPTSNTTYTVTVAQNGCTDTASATIIVTNPPNAGNNGTVFICSNGIAFTALDYLSGIPDDTGFWTPNLIGGVFDPGINGSGTYTYTVEGSGGCPDSTAALIVTIYPAPNANAGVDTMVVPFESISLYGSGGTSYVWSPATGLSCTQCQNPNVSVSSDATYCVTVTDTNGCVNTDCINITMNISGEVWSPTIFSPNGDGLNDIFYIRGPIQEDLFLLRIYNRWGEKVHETSDPKTGWDGTQNGKPLNTGVVAYIASGISWEGNEFELKGNLTMLAK